MRSVLLMILATFSSAAIAVPIKWTLQDVVFQDGAVATGYFILDSDPNTNGFIDINIDVAGGTFLPAVHYDDAAGAFGGWPILVVGGEYDSTLSLYFEAGLRDETLITLQDNLGPGYYAGDYNYCCGTLSFASYQYVGDPTLDEEVNPLISGAVVGSIVPIPAAVWLFGSALAGLGWLRRKQTT